MAKALGEYLAVKQNGKNGRACWPLVQEKRDDCIQRNDMYGEGWSIMTMPLFPLVTNDQYSRYL